MPFLSFLPAIKYFGHFQNPDTGLDVWKDRILAIRYTQMADYKVRGETTLYIRQPEPLPEHISELTGITDDMLARGISLEEAVSELETLPCADTPFVFAGEDFTAGFLNAAFLRCGKTFDRPYFLTTPGHCTEVLFCYFF